MKIYALLIAVFASFFPLLGLAQNVPGQTPREIIISEITQAQSPAIEIPEETAEEPSEEPIPAPLTPPEILPPTPLPTPMSDEVIKPPVEEVQAQKITPQITKTTETVIDGSLVDNGGENISEPITITLPEEVLPQIEETLPPQIAAFYLTTEEYLAMRGTGKEPQLILNYDVSSQKKDMLLPVTAQIQIILGNDYGAVKMTSANDVEITKIYDFRLNRLLTISKKSSKKQVRIDFDNISLYAPIYRNITTVRRATQNGKLKTITLGGGKKLEAFWVESAMGWAVNPSSVKLKIKEKKSTLTVNKDKKTVFEAKFSEDGYGNDNFKQVFLRLAAHEWPLHPQVLEIFANYTSPPESFKMLSYNPGALKGETQTWTLVDRQGSKAAFPLPDKALSISQRQPSPPLVFVIGEAVRGRAFDGPQTAAELEADFEAANKSGDDAALWLIGQRYNSYTGKCDQEPETRLCARLETLEQDYSNVKILAKNKMLADPKLTKFIQAVRLAKQAGERVKILKILQPFLSEPDVPAIVLQTAGVIRAKIKPSDIITPMISALDAQALLQAALAKDPYDPNTYLGLAQINAANEAYETSWDFYDALRAVTVSPEALDIKIDKVEEKLRRTAPMYFLEN